MLSVVDVTVVPLAKSKPCNPYITSTPCVPVFVKYILASLELIATALRLIGSEQNEAYSTTILSI